MKNFTFLLSMVIILGISCTASFQNSAPSKFCGFQMNSEEITEISNWSVQTPDVYDLKSGTEIYEEINDSIRAIMPDTIDFELFLVKLTDNEVGIDAFVPNDKRFIEKIACIFMNSNFSKLVPLQRKIRIFSYSNPDGSGDSPFEVGIKSKE